MEFDLFTWWMISISFSIVFLTIVSIYLARAQESDLIVTMGCNDQGICPGPFFKPTIEWHLEDPKGKPIEKVREIRDQIELQVQELLEKELKE